MPRVGRGRTAPSFSTSPEVNEDITSMASVSVKKAKGVAPARAMPVHEIRIVGFAGEAVRLVEAAARFGIPVSNIRYLPPHDALFF